MAFYHTAAIISFKRYTVDLYMEVSLPSVNPSIDFLLPLESKPLLPLTYKTFYVVVSSDTLWFFTCIVSMLIPVHLNFDSFFFFFFVDSGPSCAGHAGKP